MLVNEKGQRAASAVEQMNPLLPEANPFGQKLSSLKVSNMKKLNTFLNLLPNARILRP